MGAAIGANDLLVFIAVVIWGVFLNYRYSSGEKDFIRIPLPDSLQKILVGGDGLIDRKLKMLTNAKRPGISLVGLVLYIWALIASIFWIPSFFGINILGIERQLVLNGIVISWIIGIFAVMIYDIIVGRFIEVVITPDKKYKYNERTTFLRGKSALKLRMRPIKTKENVDIILLFPERTVASYEKLFGKIPDRLGHTWWIVLENSNSVTGYQYIASIGLWDFNKPHRLFEYAINVENGNSTLIRDYTENPEERS